MVKKKSNKIALVIYYDEFNSEDFLIEVIRQAVGYEVSQAANCAAIINNRGKYAIKTFMLSDIEKAKAIEQVFLEQEVPAKLIYQ